MSEKETSPEIIEKELHYLNGMYQVSDGMLPKNEAHYRRGEPAAVWNKLNTENLVIISGTKGEGKTTLLRQLEGEHPDQFTYWTVDDNQLNLEEFDLDGQTIEGYDNLLKHFLDTGRVFGIDEYTRILDNIKGAPDYLKFKDFVNQAHSLGIPMVLVVHHVPRLIDRFVMDSEDLDYDQIYYPKPVSLDELQFSSHHGPFHKRGSAPFAPSALKIDDGLEMEVLKIAGDNPLLINSLWTRLLNNLFLTNFDGHFSTQTIHDYWFNLSKAYRTDSLNITRVFDFAWMRFKADPKEFAYFTQVISSPQPDFSSVDIRLLIEWEHLHLVRKDKDDNYVINGQIVRDVFTY